VLNINNKKKLLLFFAHSPYANSLLPRYFGVHLKPWSCSIGKKIGKGGKKKRKEKNEKEGA